METKYIYKGENITIDLMFKIERVVYILSKRMKKDWETVYAEFLATEFYKKLQLTNTLLWAESSEFLADEYERWSALKPNRCQDAE